MGKHEIRLRKQRITSRGSERFRNYSSVLRQHEEEKRIKIIVKIFTYFMIIAVLILLFMVVTQWEQKDETPSVNTCFSTINNCTKSAILSDQVKPLTA